MTRTAAMRPVWTTRRETRQDRDREKNCETADRSRELCAADKKLATNLDASLHRNRVVCARS